MDKGLCEGDAPLQKGAGRHGKPGPRGGVERSRRACVLPGEQGFTLLELLIAIMLLAIGVLAVTGMQTVALQANNISNQLSVGSTLCKDVLEDLLSWDGGSAAFANTVANTTYTGAPFNTAGNSYTDPNSGTYRAKYSTTVGSDVNGIPTGVTCVTVTVSYSFRGSAKQVTMTGFKRTV